MNSVSQFSNSATWTLGLFTLWTFHFMNFLLYELSNFMNSVYSSAQSAGVCFPLISQIFADFFFCVHLRNLRDTFYFQTLWTFHFVQTQGPASLRLLQHGYFMNFLLYELSTLWTQFQQFSNSAFLQLTFAHSQNPPNKISSHILNTIVNSKLSTIKKSNSLWNNPVIY